MFITPKIPVITHINEVLPHVQGREEFVVAIRDGYTIINYNVAYQDTFGCLINDPIEDHDAIAIRRECRGIVFDNETGKVIRRPFNKFFNIGEKAETQPNLYDLSKPHVIFDKLDGSLIGPFLNNNQIIWATKMAAQEFHDDVARFVDKSDIDYTGFALECIKNGFTPLFEYSTAKYRIVLEVKETVMILTGLRNMITGEYVPYEELVNLAAPYQVPVVKIYDGITDIHQFIADTKSLEFVEGFVIDFDGHKSKMKCDWYVQIHRVKESMLFDRHIITMIYDNQLDDIIPHLSDEEYAKLRKFEYDFRVYRANIVDDILTKTEDYINLCHGSKKDFAINYVKEVSLTEKAFIFSAWDEHTDRKGFLADHLDKYVQKNLSKNIRWETVQEELFPGLLYNER